MQKQDVNIPPMAVFVPLNINELLMSSVPKIPNIRDKILILIDYIYWKGVRESAKKEKGQYYVSSRKLRKLVGDYYKITPILEEIGILTVDHTYFTSTQTQFPSPKKYKIADSFLIKKVQLEYINNTPLSKKLHKVNIEQEAIKKYPKLFHYLTHDISIDHNKALKAIELKYHEAMQNKPSKAQTIKAVRQFNSRFKAISKIQLKQWNFSCSGKDKRLHTNLTNMDKMIREHLRYQRDKLVEWDINNSQPKFSTLLLDKSFYSDSTKDSKQSNLYSIVENNLHILINRKDTPTMCQKILRFSVKEDAKKYTRLCMEDKLYEYMAQKMYPDLDKQNGRSKAKKAFMTVAYSSREQSVVYPCRKLFEGIFPSVTAVFDIIKSKSYKDLALILQNIEAKVVLDIICNAVQEEYPTMPIFTIHDSILYPGHMGDSISMFCQNTLNSILRSTNNS